MVPLVVEAVEDGMDDSAHGLDIHKADHGPGAATDLHEAALDDVGIAQNRPVEDWGKLLDDAAVVSTMLDRLLHRGHALKCGPESWRTKTDLPAVDQGRVE